MPSDQAPFKEAIEEHALGLNVQSDFDDTSTRYKKQFEFSPLDKLQQNLKDHFEEPDGKYLCHKQRITSVSRNKYLCHQKRHFFVKLFFYD